MSAMLVDSSKDGRTVVTGCFPEKCDSPTGNAMDMLQEQIGHKKEAARSDVKSGDGCPSWDEFHIVAESATAKLPACHMFRCFSRIRRTINGYVQRMQSVGWYSSLNNRTVQSLYRRLHAYDATIMTCAYSHVQIG